MKTLKDIISTLDVQQVQGNQNVSIQDITADSRAVKPNSLFIALVGLQLMVTITSIKRLLLVLLPLSYQNRLLYLMMCVLSLFLIHVKL